MSLSGFNTVRGYVGYEDTRALLRRALGTDLALDVAAAAPAGQRARQQLAALVGAWEVATIQMNKETELRAEAKHLQLVRPQTRHEEGG